MRTTKLRFDDCSDLIIEQDATRNDGFVQLRHVRSDWHLRIYDDGNGLDIQIEGKKPLRLGYDDASDLFYALRELARNTHLCELSPEEWEQISDH